MNHNHKAAAWLATGLLPLCLWCGCSREADPNPPVPPRTAPATPGPRIQEAEVRELLKAMDEASSKKDVTAMMSFLAGDAKVYSGSNGALGMISQVMSRKEYEAEVRKSLDAVSDYTCQTRDLTVKVADDGQSAEASEAVIETMTDNGKKVTQESTQTYSLGRDQNGKLVVKTIHSELKPTQ